MKADVVCSAQCLPENGAKSFTQGAAKVGQDHYGRRAEDADGKATMAMWDIGFGEPVDEKLVGRYVSEAMAVRAKKESGDSEWKSLGLSAPAQRALTSAKLVRVSDLAKRTESSVSQLHGMGPNAIKLLKAAMKSKKVTFKR